MTLLKAHSLKIYIKLAAYIVSFPTECWLVLASEKRGSTTYTFRGFYFLPKGSNQQRSIDIPPPKVIPKYLILLIY